MTMQNPKIERSEIHRSELRKEQFKEEFKKRIRRFILNIIQCFKYFNSSAIGGSASGREGKEVILDFGL
jgi:hypothetical protein